METSSSSDTKDYQDSLKLTLDELHLEIQVVENLPRNPRSLFTPRREDRISREASWDIWNSPLWERGRGTEFGFSGKG